MADAPTSPKASPVDAVAAQVLDPANSRRVLFEGTLADAQAFAMQHAPRPHSDNGFAMPLLTVSDGKGNETFFDGSKWTEVPQ
jgi:hypothetical protein